MHLPFQRISSLRTSPTIINKSAFMTTQEQAIQITKDDLHLIFGESDVTKRKKSLSKLWVSSSDSACISPFGVEDSHQAISDLVDKLFAQTPGLVFKELSMTRRLNRTNKSNA